MARKLNDIELVITAKNEATKTFTSITDALKNIETASKKGGGLSSLFQGFEKRLATASAKQKQFNDLLGDTKQVQKAITAAEKYTKVVKAQEIAVSSAEKKLSDLESTYEGVEKAANTARAPAEKLAASLAAQETKQVSLAEAISKTRIEIEKSNQALIKNAGIDDKASAAIEKQKSAVIESGQAWRETTKAVSAAQKQIAALSTQKSGLQSSLGGPSQKSALESELATLKEFIKVSRSANTGDATKQLSSNAKIRIAEIQSLLKSERQVQAQLQNDLSKTNAELRRQENSFSSLTAKAGTQKRVYDELKASLTKFQNESAGAGTQRQQQNIDKLNSSLTALQNTYQKTAEKIALTQAAISKSSGADPKSIAQFQALKVNIEATRLEIVKEKAELAKLVTELDKAGLSTDALATNQRELDRVTEQLVSEEKKLVSEMKQLGDQSGRTGKRINDTSASFLKMGDDTRKSLGYMQRIRGELLAIASTYTGIFAISEAIHDVFEESVNLSKAQSRISVFFNGDEKRVAEEINFVTKAAKDLKVEVSVALDQYSKFISGVDESQIPLKEIRQVLIGFSTAARVGRLSTEELGRVFNAVTQIFGKQKLGLEELSGQLGDVLPGAVKRTADALQLGEDGVKKLFKAISNGNVSSEAAVLLAHELEQAYGVGLTKALESPDAALADFKNSIRDIKLEIADSGFIQKLAEGLKEVTTSINAGEFKSGIQSLANGLVQIVNVGVLLIKNLDHVKTALQIAFGLKVIGILNGFRLSMLGASAAITAFGTSISTVTPKIGLFVTRLGAALTMLLRFAGPVGILVTVGVAWYQFSKGAEISTESLDKLTGSANDAAEAFLKLGKAQQAQAKLQLTKEIEAAEKSIKSLEQELSGVSGRKLMGANLTGDLSKSFVQSTENIINYRAEIEKANIHLNNLKNNLKVINDPDSLKNLTTQFKEATNIEGLLSETDIAEIRARVRKSFEGITEAQQAALDKLRERVGDELAKIGAEIDEKSAGTLEARIEAIGVQYNKLLRDIVSAGGGKLFPGAEDTINQITAIKQLEEIEKEINKLIQERRTLTAAINDQVELGAVTSEDANKRIAEVNARILPQMNQALIVAKEIADQVDSKPMLQVVENQKLLVQLENQKAVREELLNLENEINRAMEIRRDKIQTINAMIEAGNLSELAGRNQIFQLNADTKTQLDETITQALKLAQSLGDQSAVENLKQINIELSIVKKNIIDADTERDKFSTGLTDALFEFGEGAKSAKEAFSDFISSFLRDIAKAIIQALILKAITNATQNSSWFGAAVSAVNGASNHHTGGTVSGQNKHRNVPLAAFAGAVRYHSGGIAGLMPNEVPSILQKGEEVLTKNDPRHVNNGGTQTGGSPQNIKIINTIDSASVLNQALTSDAGQKILVNSIRANKSAIKTVLM